MRAEQMWGYIIHLWCKQPEFISWHWLLIFTNRKCSEMWNTVKHEMELSMEWSVERSDPWEPKLKIEKNRLIRLLPWKSCKLGKATHTSTYTLSIFLIHTAGSALVLLYVHSLRFSPWPHPPPPHRDPPPHPPPLPAAAIYSPVKHRLSTTSALLVGFCHCCLWERVADEPHLPLMTHKVGCRMAVLCFLDWPVSEWGVRCVL